MITIYVYRDGTTAQVPSIDRAWLDPASGVFLWVDLPAPSVPESLILSETFGFHPLSVEDAVGAAFPRSSLRWYLYLILHGSYHAGNKGFARTTSIFRGANYLVTVHDGHSRSSTHQETSRLRGDERLSRALLHPSSLHVDRFVRCEKSIPPREARETVFSSVLPQHSFGRSSGKASGSGLRLLSRRSATSSLGGRAAVAVVAPTSRSLRGDDSLVRIADDATLFHDRINGVLEAHLSNVSNRLNEVMKVLTILTTIFMPLTLLSGLWGMNILLPRFPGTDREQFWWIVGIMTAIVAAMLVMFRRKRWI